MTTGTKAKKYHDMLRKWIAWKMRVARKHCKTSVGTGGGLRIENMNEPEGVYGGIQKEIVLREERCAAQLKARNQRSSRNSVEEDTP